MPQQLILELPDDLYQHLLKWSEQTGETPEAWATEWLTGTIQRLANDPLLQLAGSVESEVPNVCEHLDDHLGTALLRELRGKKDDE